MYKILNSKYDNEKKDKRYCDIYCDTAADLPNKQEIANDFIDVGSWAWIGEDRTFKTLDSNGQWV